MPKIRLHKPSTRSDDNSPTIEKKRGRTTLKTQNFRYTWMIDNYSLCNYKVGEVVESPIFSFMAERELQWCLKLYPSSHDSNDENYVSIFLCLRSKVQADLRVRYKLCILSKNDEETNVFDRTRDIFSSKNSSWGTYEFIKKDYLQREGRELLLPNDTLTIICDIVVANGMDSQPGASFNVPEEKMSVDVGHWFENPQFADIKLIVSGRQFLAHKVILAARSSVFAAMFNVKQEKQEVVIVDIAEEIFEELLRFIYSEKVKDLKKVAKDLIMAADRYALDRLKVMCEEELYASLTVGNAAEVLIIADRYNSIELQKQAIDFIVQHVTDVVKTAGYKMMLTTPALLDRVLQAIVAGHCKLHSGSGATNPKSAGTAT